jgi:hypothetical protein
MMMADAEVLACARYGELDELKALVDAGQVRGAVGRGLRGVPC